MEGSKGSSKFWLDTSSRIALESSMLTVWSTSGGITASPGRSSVLSDCLRTICEDQTGGSFDVRGEIAMLVNFPSIQILEGADTHFPFVACIVHIVEYS